MSVCNYQEVQVDLPRTGLDPFWDRLLTEYAGRDNLRLRRLAMLSLREVAGWPMREIARVMGLDSGHVSRSITRVKSDLRKRYTLEDGPLCTHRGRTDAA